MSATISWMKGLPTEPGTYWVAVYGQSQAWVHMAHVWLDYEDAQREEAGLNRTGPERLSARDLAEYFRSHPREMFFRLITDGMRGSKERLDGDSLITHHSRIEKPGEPA